MPASSAPVAQESFPAASNSAAVKRRRRYLALGGGVLLLVALVFVGVLGQPADQSGVLLTPSARVAHGPVNEQSGVVASRTYPGLFWVHNDSGDTARVFAMDRGGRVVIPEWLENRDFYVGPPSADKSKQPYPGITIDLANNIDWEDITLGDGNLYLCDMGNNGNARRDLGIYVVREPNPLSVHRTRVLGWVPVEYPDQTEFPPRTAWEYDCEASFWFRGHLYFITKHRPAYRLSVPALDANLYRLDQMTFDRVNPLRKVDHQELGGWVTAADVAPDESCLAVLVEAPVQSVWLFDTPPQGDQFFQQAARRLVFHGAGQAEGLCFIDNETLMLTNEGRQIFELKVSDFKPAAEVSRTAGRNSPR